MGDTKRMRDSAGGTLAAANSALCAKPRHPGHSLGEDAEDGDAEPDVALY